MTYYHVRISEVGNRRDEVKLDLDEEALERQFLHPYRSGTAITINGKTIPMDRLERIRINGGEADGKALISEVKRRDAASSVAVLGGPSLEWRAAALAEDVTDQFITGPPGEQARQAEPLRASRSVTSPAETRQGPAGNTVFVVTGRDTPITAAITSFLRSLGLRVVEWEHAVAKTGVPNPYVGDVVEEGLRMADAALVILTPDDIVRLRDDLLRDDDPEPERELRGQARPNVFYEAGFADALGRDRTVIVEVGRPKSFTDVTGRHVVRYDGSAPMRNTLAARLRVAGLDVDTSGQEWLSVGNLSELLSQLDESVEAATKSQTQDAE
jgi:predicted nucleotide-binding protein